MVAMLEVTIQKDLKFKVELQPRWRSDLTSSIAAPADVTVSERQWGRCTNPQHLVQRALQTQPQTGRQLSGKPTYFIHFQLVQELCRSHCSLPKLSVPKGCCSVPVECRSQPWCPTGMHAVSDPTSPCHCYTSHLKESTNVVTAPLILHTQGIQGPSTGTGIW